MTLGFAAPVSFCMSNVFYASRIDAGPRPEKAAPIDTADSLTSVFVNVYHDDLLACKKVGLHRKDERTIDSV